MQFQASELCANIGASFILLTSPFLDNIRFADHPGVIPSIALGGTFGLGSAYIIPRKAVHVLFAHTDGSYLRGDLRVAVGNRCNVFPEWFRPPCARGKNLCRIH